MDEFWEKASFVRTICDGRITIFSLLKSYQSYLSMSMYNDLMMLNKFELELLTQVTVVLLLNNPHDLQNIQCTLFVTNVKILLVRS